MTCDDRTPPYFFLKGPEKALEGQFIVKMACCVFNSVEKKIR